MVIKPRSGFTLIELLVVIAVASILAAVVLVAIDPVEKFANANDAQRKSDLGQVVTGMNSYYFSNGASYSSIDMTTLVNEGHLKREFPNISIATDTNATSAIAYTELTSQKETCPTGQTGTKYWVYRSATGGFNLECTSATPTL